MLAIFNTVLLFSVTVAYVIKQDMSAACFTFSGALAWTLVAIQYGEKQTTEEIN